MIRSGIKKIFIFVLLSCAIIPQVLQARSAPNFKLKDLGGKEFDLNKTLTSGPVLIDFWATWCQPCIKALPILQEIESMYASKGLTVVGINEDGPRNLPKVRPFLRSHKLEFRVLLDLNSSVMNAYRLNSIPTTILIDKTGEIVYFHQGYKPGDEVELKKAIEKLLEAVE